MLAELDLLAREYYEIGADEPCPYSHLDYAESIVAAGGSLRRLAAKLTDALGFTVDRETLRRYLYSLDADRVATPAERMSRARATGGHALAEESLDILDTATVERAQLANSQARGRQWLAERWSPAELGSQKGVNIAISVTQLHLQALQHVNNTVTGASETDEIAAHNTTYIPNGNGQVVVTPLLTEPVRAPSSDNE